MSGASVSRRGFMGVTGSAALGVALPAAAENIRPTPLIYAHRGASALRPEHTLGSYAKAIQDGADFIEPDLVITRDGVLVSRHENNIADTTDVATRSEFADRKTTKTLFGRPQEGWFTEDFTFAELKTLRAVERLKDARPTSRSYDGQFQIVSFEEIVDFVAAESAARGRIIGLAPELKHGTYFATLGLPLQERFVDLMGRHRYTRAAPVHVQSAEIGNLRALRRHFPRTSNVKLLQLCMNNDFKPEDVAAAGGTTTYRRMWTAQGLREIATYADIAAPYYRDLMGVGADGRLKGPTSFVADAQTAGLKVVAWTFAPENRSLAAEFRSSDPLAERNPPGSIAEMRRYLALGLDGLFSDDPALARVAIHGK